jgi:hypothetical protein
MIRHEAKIPVIWSVNKYYFKYILLFNKKQMDRTQVSQLRNDFSKINTSGLYLVFRIFLKAEASEG